MKTLDLIVPCYNEEECVKLFYEKAMSVVPQIEVLSNWQVIFVNDGSKDNTLEEILKINILLNMQIQLRLIIISIEPDWVKSYLQKRVLREFV